MAESEIKIVAVTGASGFIGSHVTEAALGQSPGSSDPPHLVEGITLSWRCAILFLFNTISDATPRPLPCAAAGLTVRATVRDKDNKDKTAHLTKLAEGKVGIPAISHLCPAVRCNKDARGPKNPTAVARCPWRPVNPDRAP